MMFLRLEKKPFVKRTRGFFLCSEINICNARRPQQPVDRNIGASFRGAVLPVAARRCWPDRRGYHLIVNRGARLSSRAAVASLRVGLPPDARCGIHDDVVDTLGLGEHGHMA